jgi:seryl-tRNA synthetase
MSRGDSILQTALIARCVSEDGTRPPNQSTFQRRCKAPRTSVRLGVHCPAVIDLRLLRDNRAAVEEAYARLGAPVDLDKVTAQDERVRDLKNESQTLQAEQNRLSKEIGRAAPGAAREQTIAEVSVLKRDIAGKAAELAAAEARLDELLLELPNLPHPSVPVGKDESENRIVREEGTRRSYDFALQPHWDLGTRLGIIDFERGVKISGSRFYVLKSWGARLQRALITYMLDLHTQKHGYVEIYPPYMVRRECLVGTGNLPKFGENLYHDAEEDFWFIPTAEVPVTNLYREEILDGGALPIRHVAFTACFRREQMAAGRDTRGIKRGHQFDKVELVKFVRPETSMDELTALLADAEDVLKGLELPYRVVQMCTGDLSFSAMAKFDLELWAPGCDEWLEVSSCSNFGDFQARRARIRFKDATGKEKSRFVHTLNGSGLALPRTLIGILETYQRADGRVDVPRVLRPYLGGAEVLPEALS